MRVLHCDNKYFNPQILYYIVVEIPNNILIGLFIIMAYVVLIIVSLDWRSYVEDKKFFQHNICIIYRNVRKLCFQKSPGL